MCRFRFRSASAFRCSGGSATWQLQGYSYHHPPSRSGQIGAETATGRPPDCAEAADPGAKGGKRSLSPDVATHVEWRPGGGRAEDTGRSTGWERQRPQLTTQNRSLFSPVLTTLTEAQLWGDRPTTVFQPGPTDSPKT